MAGDLGDHVDMRAGMQQDGLVDPRQVLGHQLNDQVDAGLAVFAAIERYDDSHGRPRHVYATAWEHRSPPERRQGRPMAAIGLKVPGFSKFNRSRLRIARQ